MCYVIRISAIINLIRGPCVVAFIEHLKCNSNQNTNWLLGSFFNHSVDCSMKLSIISIVCCVLASFYWFAIWFKCWLLCIRYNTARHYGIRIVWFIDDWIKIRNDFQWIWAVKMCLAKNKNIICSWRARVLGKSVEESLILWISVGIR